MCIVHNFYSVVELKDRLTYVSGKRCVGLLFADD